MTRDNKGTPTRDAKKSPDPTNRVKRTGEERLLSQLQKESLKVHGDPLDPKKQGQGTKEEK
jgi:hypothetical protein